MENTSCINLFRHIVLADFLRYFIPACFAYLIFWVFFKHRWHHRNIQQKQFLKTQLWREFGYSMSTVLIFATIGFFIFLAKKAGYTRIYDTVEQYGTVWFTASILVMVALHDAYFYWTHRLMHHPKIFRHVHLTHHRSMNPSPWAAYAFHPFEAIIEAGIFPLIIFTMPTHPMALFVFLAHMIFRNVLGHLGIELFSKNFLKNGLINWNTTTTHHDLHHKDFHYNYGFYFTWWDKICQTEHPDYQNKYEAVTAQEPDFESGNTSKKGSISKFLLCLFIANTPIFAVAQSPVGVWKTMDDRDGQARSLVKIEVTGETLSGKIVDIFTRPCEQAEPICQKCSGEYKNAPVKGMYILWGFKKEGAQWKNGYILDPANGKTYLCKIWLEADGKALKVRGYWGIFWRTQIWYRVE